MEAFSSLFQAVNVQMHLYIVDFNMQSSYGGKA